MNDLTERQAEIYALYEKCGNAAETARNLGVSRSTVTSALKQIRLKQERYSKPYASSTLYNEKGDVKLQWVKELHDTNMDSIMDVLDRLGDDLPACEYIEPVTHVDNNFLAVYPLGDPHFGMYAWEAETGEDFDLDLASQNLRRIMKELIALTPPSQVCLILNLGDFFHADNSTNRTPKSQHPLDVDTRWSKVIKVGVDAMVECINSAVSRHGFVIVKNLPGNHDTHSSIALGHILKAYYRNCDSVNVDISPDPFYYFRHGNTLIGACHGDMVKQEMLHSIMAADRPKDWGETRHRYWYTGHVHHKRVLELTGGVIAESFRTLAPRDAWTHSAGFRSGRDQYGIVIDPYLGEKMRIRLGLEAYNEMG